MPFGQPSTAVILFGPPGGSKTTLNKRGLVPLCGATVVGSGAYFRQQEEQKTSFWTQELAERMRLGMLIPDEEVMEAYRCIMHREHHPTRMPRDMLVLDGIPRSCLQAEHVVNDLRKRWYDAVYVIAINTPEHICRNRLKLRAREEGRLDDDLHSIDRRLAEFAKYRDGVLGRLEDLTDGVYHFFVQRMIEDGHIEEISDVINQLRYQDVLPARNRRIEGSWTKHLSFADANSGELDREEIAA